ncbi:hypothetical protein Hypma_006439 [Hypsizygus marmoreus]|uniref:Uncharacterized protein n=1 Tax=Hypsizygus marmoreus TaxID=39966 RepID=A0A369K2P3_HYPMA|nr:hypothetical protein Hypma_006439 [Hypsizygus marmoreus]
MAPSAAQKLLDEIVPRVPYPRLCPRGYQHVANLSLGSKYPADIGRRSWYCKGQACTGSPGMMLYPPFPSDIQTHLHEILSKARKHEVVLKSNTKAVKDGMKKYLKSLEGDTLPSIVTLSPSTSVLDPPIGSSTSASISPPRSSSEPDGILVFIFIAPYEKCVEHYAVVSNGSYSPHEDIHFCQSTGFPQWRYSVYDSFYNTFVPMPSFIRLDVTGHGILVFRPLSFTDEECLDVAKLIDGYVVDNTCRAKAAGKRKARPQSDEEGPGSSQPGPSKRQRSGRYIADITDLDVWELSDS